MRVESKIPRSRHPELACIKYSIILVYNGRKKKRNDEDNETWQHCNGNMADRLHSVIKHYSTSWWSFRGCKREPVYTQNFLRTSQHSGATTLKSLPYFDWLVGWLEFSSFVQGLLPCRKQ